MLCEFLTFMWDSSEKCQELDHPQDTMTALDCPNRHIFFFFFAETSINIFGVQSYGFFLNDHWKEWPCDMGEVVLNVLDDGWWYYIVSDYIVPEEAQFGYRKGISLDICYRFLFVLWKQKLCRLAVYGLHKKMWLFFCLLMKWYALL